MQLAREIRLGVFTLIILNLIISFGSIMLLGRMTPATELSLRENVVSTAAIQQMLSALATDRYRQPEGWTEFEEAFQRAAANVTEASEPKILSEIHQQAELARTGNQQAETALVESLQRLGTVNRGAMEQRSEQAKRLGIAGAWAIVFMGFVSFLSGGVVLRDFLKRISTPVEEIAEVLTAWRHGEVHRRCRRMSTSQELTAAINSINFLLDDEVKPLADRDAIRNAKDAETRDRRIVHDLLESLPGSAFIVGPDEQIVATNQSGLNELSGPAGDDLRERIAKEAAGSKTLPESGCRLVLSESGSRRV